MSALTPGQSIRSSQGGGGPIRRRRDPGEFMTVVEVAAKLKVSRATVYRLVDEELLARIWVGTPNVATSIHAR